MKKITTIAIIFIFFAITKTVQANTIYHSFSGTIASTSPSCLGGYAMTSITPTDTVQITTSSYGGIYAKSSISNVNWRILLSSTTNMSLAIASWGATGGHPTTDYSWLIDTAFSPTTLIGGYTYYVGLCWDSAGAFDFLTDNYGNFNGYIDTDTAINTESTNTRFISFIPPDYSVVATTTQVGAIVYANPNDFPSPYGRLKITGSQNSAFACINSGAIYDIIYTCSGDNAPQPNFTITFDSTVDKLISGLYSLSTTTTFSGGGNWTLKYEIQQISEPWYLFGLQTIYTTILSTTTQVTIGTTSPMDRARNDLASSTAERRKRTAGAISATTTEMINRFCNPIATSSNLLGIEYNGYFDVVSCLANVVVPPDSAVKDRLNQIRLLPPWGYVFRFIDILNMPLSSTTLPTISYSFSSTSPMSVVGDIHFDPLGSVMQSGTLINEMKSDRNDSKTVWEIFMPFIKIVIYLALLLEIGRELSGIDWTGARNKEKI